MSIETTIDRLHNCPLGVNEKYTIHTVTEHEDWKTRKNIPVLISNPVKILKIQEKEGEYIEIVYIHRNRKSENNGKFDKAFAITKGWKQFKNPVLNPFMNYKLHEMLEDKLVESSRDIEDLVYCQEELIK